MYDLTLTQVNRASIKLPKKDIQMYENLFLRKQSLGVTIGIFSIFFARFMTWAANPSGSRQPDSASYLPTKWMDLGQVSFTGNSSRAWVVPLFYTLFPNDQSRVLAQLLTGAIAWTSIILMTMKIAQPSKARNAIIIFEIVLAISPNILQFESVLLATSFLLYAMLIFIMLSLYFYLQKRNSSKIFLLVVFAGYINVSLKLVNLPIIIFTLFFIAFHYLKSQKSNKKVPLIAIMIISILQASWVGLNNDKFWENTYSGTALLWHLGSQSPSALPFSKYLSESGAPKCITKNAPYSDISMEIADITSSCASAGPYLASGIKKDFAQFVLKNPDVIMRLLSMGFAISLTGTSSHYGSAATLVPMDVNEILFGSVNPDFRISGIEDQSAALNLQSGAEPLWVSTPSLFLFILAGFLLIINFRKHNINFLLALISGMLYVQMSLNSIVLPSEWFRQNIHFTVPLMLMSVIAIATNSRKLTFEHT